MLGWLIAPLAVMLAIAAIMVAGIRLRPRSEQHSAITIVAFGAIRV